MVAGLDGPCRGECVVQAGAEVGPRIFDGIQIWSSFVMLQPEGESTRCERKSWSPHRVVGLLPSVDRRSLLSSVVHVQYFDANAVVIS